MCRQLFLFNLEQTLQSCFPQVVSARQMGSSARASRPAEHWIHRAEEDPEADHSPP